MRRREFVSFAAGAAAAWPLAAGAQQRERVRRIGVLMGFAEGDPEAAARIAALVAGLRDFGWTEGRNLQLEFSWGVDTVERTQEAVANLVATNPDIILATTTPHAQELQRQTRTIPVVFVNLSDPLDSGVVASLARPGGNTTGFMSLELTVAGKWVEALKEVVPSIRHILALVNAGNDGNLGYLRLVDASASTLGIQLVSAAVRDASETERAIGSISGDPHAGLIVLPGPPIQDHRQLIFAMAAQQRLPAIYAFRFFTAEGGLMSYGSDVRDIWRRSADYVHRILRGEKPGDLPVQFPTKFELVVNLKTAKAIGLTIPEAFLLRADEVIE